VTPIQRVEGEKKNSDGCVVFFHGGRERADGGIFSFLKTEGREKRFRPPPLPKGGTAVAATGS